MVNYSFCRKDSGTIIEQGEAQDKAHALLTMPVEAFLVESLPPNNSGQWCFLNGEWVPFDEFPYEDTVLDVGGDITYTFNKPVDVWVDGVFKGVDTSVRLTKNQPGRHTLMVSLGGHIWGEINVEFRS